MNTQVDWDKFRVFYHIAKAGSFTNASSKLYISQPALSRTIQALEYQLKLNLFQRKARGVSLTEEGHILFNAVHTMFQELESMSLKISHLKTMNHRPLNIATTSSLATLWVPHFLPKVLSENPEISVQISTVHKNIDLSICEADIIIQPEQKAKTKTKILQEYLTTLHLGFYASPLYLQKKQLSATLNDFENQTLILSDNADEANPAGVLDRNLLKNAELLKIDSIPATLEFAKAGMGIVPIWKECVPFSDLQNQSLVPLEVSFESPNLPLYITYLERFQDIASIKNFIAVLNQYINMN